MVKGKIEKGESKPYIRVIISPSLKDRLDLWKESSGSSYANTARTALIEYLELKLGEIPQAKKDAFRGRSEKPQQTETAPDAVTIRRELKSHFKILLDHLKTEHGGEFEKAGKDLEREIIERADDFKIAGYEPTLAELVEIMDLDKNVPADLKIYAKNILAPPTRRRGKGK